MSWRVEHNKTGYRILAPHCAFVLGKSDALRR